MDYHLVMVREFVCLSDPLSYANRILQLNSLQCQRCWTGQRVALSLMKNNSMALQVAGWGTPYQLNRSQLQKYWYIIVAMQGCRCVVMYVVVQLCSVVDMQLCSYMATQLQNYTATYLLHICYTATELPSFIAIHLHHYTATQLHRYTAAMLHIYNTTQLHRQIATVLHSYNATQLHQYPATMIPVSRCLNANFVMVIMNDRQKH